MKMNESAEKMADKNELILLVTDQTSDVWWAKPTLRKGIFATSGLKKTAYLNFRHLPLISVAIKP